MICADVGIVENFVCVQKVPSAHIQLKTGHQMESINLCAAVECVHWMIGKGEYPSIRRRLGSQKPFIRGMLRLAANNFARQTNVIQEYKGVLPIKQDPMFKNWSQEFESKHPWLHYAELTFLLFSFFLMDFPVGFDTGKSVWDDENSRIEGGVNPLRAYLSALMRVMERDGEHASSAMSFSSTIRLLTGAINNGGGDEALQDLTSGKCNRANTAQFLSIPGNIPTSSRPLAVCGGCGIVALGDEEVRKMKLCGRCRIMSGFSCSEIM